ncbi:MAG: EAL domain-containing protein [Methylibium sp.]|nr:EAL domain-containing protein [Methylibium sp.]
MTSTIPIRASNFAPLEELPARCGDCADGEQLGFEFSFAYQPIVDLDAGSIYAHEALVRGPAGEGAMSVLSQVNEANRYRFDQSCRVKAIKGAVQLGLTEKLSINFLPNAVYRPEACIRTTLAAARAHGFPIENIIFETTEGERVGDGAWYAQVMNEYQRIGFLTAIDDFGAGYAGLNLLSQFQPDLVKLDMELIRGIDTHKARQIIVTSTVRMCRELGVLVIAEGIETVGEMEFLRSTGVSLMQGYLFARPSFQSLVTAEAIPYLRR